MGLADTIQRIDIAPFRLPGRISVLGFTPAGRPQLVHLRSKMTRSQVIDCVRMACGDKTLEAIQACDENLRAGGVDQAAPSNGTFKVLVGAFRACVKADGTWRRATIAYHNADFNERQSRGYFNQLRDYFEPESPKAQQRASDELDRAIDDLKAAAEAAKEARETLVQAFAGRYALSSSTN